MSCLEKLHDGLGLIRKMQPAAPMEVHGRIILVGDTEDPHIPRGLGDRLAQLGFKHEKHKGMFAFEIPQNTAKEAVVTRPPARRP